MFRASRLEAIREIAMRKFLLTIRNGGSENISENISTTTNRGSINSILENVQ